MSIQFFFFILLIFNHLSFINSLYLYIDTQEKVCVKKFKKSNEILNIIYSISGQEEDKNIITVDDPDNNNILRELDSNSNKIYLFTQIDGYYKFCVENLSAHQVTLSFFFGDENSNEKLSIKNVENFVDGVSKLSKKIDKLKFNIGNSAIIKKTHFNIAENIRNKINICTIIKIIFLLFFSVIQIVLITSIFSKVKIIKKIEINSDEKKPLKNKINQDFL